MDFNQQPPFQQPPFQPPTPKIPERNIVTCIILSIVTCGLYIYYWLFCLNEDVNTITGNRNGTTGGMVILLSIITCGIYLYYWFYKQGDAIDNLKVQRGRSAGSLGILYFILTFFGLGIVSYALMQNELNTLAKEQF